MLEPQLFPEEIRKLIEANRRRAGQTRECLACDGGCCTTSGFALFQNVALAYQDYASDALRFQLQPGLSPQQFLHTYFDVVQVTPEECPDLAGPLLVFFPCSIVKGETLTHVTPVEGTRAREGQPFALHEYHASRRAARAELPFDWHCVFWNGALPLPAGGGRTFGGCSLHGKQSGTHLTAKPVGCVFSACHTPPDLVEPGRAELDEWLLALGRHYGPGSGAEA
jgi:hypothetical protein